MHVGVEISAGIDAGIAVGAALAHGNISSAPVNRTENKQCS